MQQLHAVHVMRCNVCSTNIVKNSLELQSTMFLVRLHFDCCNSSLKVIHQHCHKQTKIEEKYRFIEFLTFLDVGRVYEGLKLVTNFLSPMVSFGINVVTE